MRVLGIDYGEKRIGVAIGDELGFLAHGLTVIIRYGNEQDVEKIAQLVCEHNIKTLVVGYPVLLNGTEGIQCKKVNDFIEILSARITIPIVREDESCTSSYAAEIIRNNKSKRQRQHRRHGLVDKIAAVLILQSYLERMRRCGIGEGGVL
jgi:putative Holliday junction resolvase